MAHRRFVSRHTLGFSLALAAPSMLLACSGATDASVDGPQDSGALSNEVGGDDGGTDGNPEGDGSDTGTSTKDTGTSTADTGGDTKPPPTNAIKTVFVIMMENHDWSAIQGSASAPYVNGTLLPKSAYATSYFTPPGNHPSEPNYLWLEAGSNLGITDDGEPSANHQGTKDHLVSQLQSKGVSWKAYAEDIDGKSCPLTSTGLFATKHTAMLFFDDVTGGSATSAGCISHVRPFTELATDLSGGKAARFNFITPNLCNDMHGETFGFKCSSFGADLVKIGDDWLKTNVPTIEASAQFKDGGALFVIWDEGGGFTGGSDGPVGLIIDSPLAKIGPAATKYTHSSTLKTWEEIFGVPLLRDAGAATTTDLAAMFTSFP